MTKKQKDNSTTILMTAKVPFGTPMKEYLRETNPKEMSVHEKDVLCALLAEAPELPYPLEELPLAYGKPAFSYKIPEDKRAEILKALFPFVTCPDLEDVFFDLHESKFFKAKEYLVIRERNRNMLVSPYYASTGGMVVDWVPEDSVEEFLGSLHDDSSDVRTFAQEAKEDRRYTKRKSQKEESTD